MDATIEDTDVAVGDPESVGALAYRLKLADNALVASKRSTIKSVIATARGSSSAPVALSAIACYPLLLSSPLSGGVHRRVRGAAAALASAATPATATRPVSPGLLNPDRPVRHDRRITGLAVTR